LFLHPGLTCWRIDKASRAAVLIDMADYFDAAMEAMNRAEHSVHFLNWAFEATTFFHPQPGGGGEATDRIGNFLVALARNPNLDVRVLCWKSAMPVAATQHFFPLVDREIFVGSQVKFVLDGKLPIGGCHHQKVLVIDDAIAFCGGGDIGPDRWDTPLHLDDDPRREKTRRDNKCFDSRHEVMAVVDGPAAAALGGLFRDRWLRATGESLGPSPPVAPPPWPGLKPPMLTDVDVGLSRTQSAWKNYPEIRENEALHIDAIRGAKSCIYMENQYFTSPIIADELARRLTEPEGPEVLLVSSEQSPSYFDQATMDRTRLKFIRTLKDADRHGRFNAYCPVTTLGRTIIVHAKLTIIDDGLLRIGSANINNRSMGFDTECDLTLQASGPGSEANRRAITLLRSRLLAHWLGCTEALMDDEIVSAGAVGAAVERLRTSGYCRLRPLAVTKLNPLEAFIAAYHLGDPIGPDDAWRPWKRRAALVADADGARERAKRRRTQLDGAQPSEARV